jgi:hypothetical protein
MADDFSSGFARGLSIVSGMQDIKKGSDEKKRLKSAAEEVDQAKKSIAEVGFEETAKKPWSPTTVEYLGKLGSAVDTAQKVSNYETPAKKTDRESNRQMLDAYVKQGGDVSALAKYMQETPDQPMVAMSKGFKSLEDKKIAMDLNQKYVTAVKDFPDVRTKYDQMEQIYKMGKETGEWGQADQALLVLMQKALDPTSVVRETEFTRSLLTQSWFNRSMGKLEQAVKGGGGLVDDERRKLIEVARKMYRSAESMYKVQRGSFSDLASSELYQINPEMVVMQDLSIPENFYESGAPKTAFKMKGGKYWKPVAYYPAGHPKAGQPSSYTEATEKEINELES